MATHRHGFTEELAATFMEKMLSAVLYCHSHGCVHRDIKLNNMVLQGPEEDAEPKLIDFGFASIVSPGDEKMWDLMGTPGYMAPELWDSNSCKAYTSSVDVWALGVCAYLLLTGELPFSHRNRQELRRMIRDEPPRFASPQHDHVSAAGKDFCLQLLQKKATQRPSPSGAIAHEWIQKRSELHSGLDAAHVLERRQSAIRSLEDFAEAEHLKQIALAAVAFSTPPVKLEELRALFHKMDTDDSGTLSLAEFKAAMALHPELSEARLEHIFHTMDVTAAGEVDYTEFLGAMISSQASREGGAPHGGNALSLYGAFAMLDGDHDGCITHDDLSFAFSGQISDESLSRMLKRVGGPEGRIKFEQFQQMMLEEASVDRDVSAQVGKLVLAERTSKGGKFEGETFSLAKLAETR